MHLRAVATLAGVVVFAATLSTPTSARTDVLSVPASIAADCSRDVAAELNRWIRSVPDGSTLTFGSGACYRIETPLEVVDRASLTFEGNAATFRASTPGDAGRGQWHLQGGSNLTLRNLTAVGVNPQPSYEPRYEWQHNFAIQGTQGALLDQVAGRNAYGDHVAINPDSRACCGASGAIPARNITIRNSSFHVAGRQGIFCGYCENLWIDGNHFDGVGFNVVDIEIEDDLWYGRDIRITNNVTERLHSHFVANTGPGRSNGVIVAGNVMHRPSETCRAPIYTYSPTSGRRSGYRVEGNRLKALGSAMRFNRSTDITVRDNVVAFSPAGCGSLAGVAVSESHNGVVTANDFTGAADIFEADTPVSGWTVCDNRNGTRSALPEPCPDAPPVRAIDDACPPDRVSEDGFADVAPTSNHEFPIDCVVWRRIASGTSTTTYHPEWGVTRAQLATFIANLVRTAGGQLPADPPDRFVDDEGSVHEQAINALAALGMVSGTTADRYAPRQTVTRGQMATFLVRAYAHRSGTTPSSSGDWFSDDETSPHEGNINQAASAGFTAGTGAGRYTPAGPVTRGQMASFLARVLDLLIQEGHAPR